MTDTLSALTALATVLAALAAAAAVWVSWRGIAKQNAQARRPHAKISSCRSPLICP